MDNVKDVPQKTKSKYMNKNTAKENGAKSKNRAKIDRVFVFLKKTDALFIRTIG